MEHVQQPLDRQYRLAPARRESADHGSDQQLDIPIGEVAAGVLSGASPFGFALGRIISGGTTIDVLLNALEQKGIARSLAEPNLVALSGDTASFLAGGEYPIPVAGTSARSPSTTRNTASGWLHADGA